MDAYSKTVAYWQEQQVAGTGDLDRVLHNFRILFAYHSGKIENDEIAYHDTREIFENGRVCGYTGSPRALFEQQNQKLCYEFLKQKIVEKTPLTVALIREIHEALTGGTYDERRFIEQGERPGEYKKHDYVTGRLEVGSLPEDVEDDLAALVAEVNEASNDNPLAVGAYFHAHFEYIHPFADGNGRVGRTLLNYILMIRNHPPLIIYDEDKADYYSALEAYDAHEDLSMMILFVKHQTVKTWEKTLERAHKRTANGN